MRPRRSVMRLHDVNVLVYAHRKDMPQHPYYRDFLTQELSGDHTYAVSDMVVNGFLRLVTNPKVFKAPTPMAQALAFADQVRHQPHAVVISPGSRHWSIFAQLCHGAGVSGVDLPDAYLAALAVEHGCELVTADRGFARFQGLRLHPPIDAGQAKAPASQNRLRHRRGTNV